MHETIREFAALTLTLAGAVPVAAGATGPAPIGIVERPTRVPVKHGVVIVSAYSCPFCRVLDAQAMSELRGTWGPRGLSIETVPVVISPTDVAATIASTCGDMRGYARRSTILFRAQPDILGNWNAVAPEVRRRAADMPAGSGAPEIARLSGIDALAPSLGLAPGRLAACLADPRRQRAVGDRVERADARWSIVGTPTVILDGRKVEGGWAALRPRLQKTFGG